MKIRDERGEKRGGVAKKREDAGSSEEFVGEGLGRVGEMEKGGLNLLGFAFLVFQPETKETSPNTSTYTKR